MNNSAFKYIAPKKPLGLYIHIPFCERKCLYCDFYSQKGNKKLYKEYVSALIKQMEENKGAASSYIVDSIYIGGGTPSVLPKGLFKKLVCALRKNFNIAKDCEFTVEVNPASAGLALFKLLKKLKVNRLSVGVQSANDSELKAIGRLHDFEGALKTIELIKKAKFENFGIDIMYGLPGQTLDSFIETIEKVTEIAPSHISVYGLKLEEGTPLYDNRENLELPDEDTEREMYFTAVRALALAGYRQEEISNFSREGYHSRHNNKYWNCDEYLGLGCAAASYFEDARFSVCRDIGKYISNYSKGTDENLIEDYFEVPPRENIGEYVMLRLRLKDGIVLDDFFRRFRKNFEEMFSEKIQKYIDTPYLTRTETGYALTPEGFYVSNYIIADFLQLQS